MPVGHRRAAARRAPSAARTTAAEPGPRPYRAGARRRTAVRPRQSSALLHRRRRATARSGDVAVTAAHCLPAPVSGCASSPATARRGSGPAGELDRHRRLRGPGVAAPTRTSSHDYAFLTGRARRYVRGDPRRQPQTVDGAVGSVGRPAASGGRPRPVDAVRGYGTGPIDPQLTCATTRAHASRASPTVDCPGFRAGTSGAPWLARRAPPRAAGIVGLVGGLQQGGCTADMSYSPAFDATRGRCSAPGRRGWPGRHLADTRRRRMLSRLPRPAILGTESASCEGDVHAAAGDRRGRVHRGELRRSCGGGASGLGS